MQSMCQAVPIQQSSTSRHLQNSTSCANTVSSLRLWAPVQPGYGSTAVAMQDKCIALETWRPTETPTEPSRHGWTMREQVQGFFRWRTTRDWCQENILDAAIAQLKHSLYDKEIEEVQQALRLDIGDLAQGRAMDELFATLIQQSRPSQATTRRKRATMECVQALDSVDPDLVPVVFSEHRPSIGMCCTYLQESDGITTCIPSSIMYESLMEPPYWWLRLTSYSQSNTEIYYTLALKTTG